MSEPTGEVRAEQPLPLDTWAALLNEWFDFEAERIEISPAMLHDLTRALERAQMVLDAAAAVGAAETPVVQPARQRQYADEERHVCPRREEAPPGWLAQHPDHDQWELRDGARCCSWCGSRNPDDLMALLRTGSVELGPTDKSYKAYLHALEGDHVGKFYFQHLTAEQQTEFVVLLNAKAFPVSYPGHFYVLPFFAVTGATS